MITLNKKDTLALHYHENKFHALDKRIKFRTLHPWWCLNCGKDIFVDYNVTTFVHIFCDDIDCRVSAKRNPSIIMQQYLLRLKNEQAKLIKELTPAELDMLEI